VPKLGSPGSVRGALSNERPYREQCRASIVTIAPSASPSSVSNFCAAGISFDFSAISICASTSAVSVAKALKTWASEHARYRVGCQALHFGFPRSC
jgi:hypothetical protein